MWRPSKATLQWELKHGDDLEYLETIVEVTGKCPEPLLTRPDALPEQLRDLYELYALLASSRPIGYGGASGISTADIIAAARAYGYEPHYLLRIVRALDAVYLRHLHEQFEQQLTNK